MFNVRTFYGTEGASDAFAIRQKVFVEEQGFQEEFDEIDARAFHAVLYKDGKALATGRTFSDGGRVFHIGRVAVLPEGRRQGLGALVMDALEEAVKQNGGASVGLSAQVQAQGFYEKLGYAAHGEIYLDEHCPHIQMIKEL